MKTYITLIAILLFSAFAKAQLQTPDLSPAATVKQTVGLTDIEVMYSRPSVKGRVIFGDDGLLPFGEFWRLGANGATTFSFSSDITIAGKALEKGDYTMLAKPAVSTWELYVYPYESSNWNSYVAQTPLLIFSAPVQKTNDFQESFEISVQDISTQTASVVFTWEQVKVHVPISFKTTEVVMANIAKMIEGPSSNDYFQAALFMHENNQDLPRALDYIQKVTKNENALFFQVYREALILKDLNKNKEALRAAQRSLALSTNAKNNDFVRLNDQLIATLK